MSASFKFQIAKSLAIPKRLRSLGSLATHARTAFSFKFEFLGLWDWSQLFNPLFPGLSDRNRLSFPSQSQICKAEYLDRPSGGVQH